MLTSHIAPHLHQYVMSPYFTRPINCLVFSTSGFRFHNAPNVSLMELFNAKYTSLWESKPLALTSKVAVSGTAARLCSPRPPPADQGISFLRWLRLVLFCLLRPGLKFHFPSVQLVLESSVLSERSGWLDITAESRSIDIATHFTSKPTAPRVPDVRLPLSAAECCCPGNMPGACCRGHGTWEKASSY